MTGSGSKLILKFFYILLYLSFSINGFCQNLSIVGKSLTLDDCIHIGLKNSPVYQMSKANLDILFEEIGISKSGYYPSFVFSASYSDSLPLELESNPGYGGLSLRLTGRQTLYDGGETEHLIDSIEYDIKAQEFDVKRTIVEIIYNIKTSYYDVLIKQDLIEVAKSSIVSAQKHLEQAIALKKEGMTPGSDIIKAQVQISNANLDLINANNDILLAKSQLSSVMGMPVNINYNVLSEGINKQSNKLPSLDEVLQLAYKNRSELKGIKAQMNSVDETIALEKSGYYPDVSLDSSLGYGIQDSDAVSNYVSVGFGVSIGIPIFEVYTTKARINRAKAQLNLLKANEVKIMRDVELEVINAWLSLKRSIDQLDVTDKSLKLAEEDLRLSEGRYKEGIGNILEIIDAQNNLTAAKTNYIVNVYNILKNRAGLEKAIGRIEE